MGKKSLMLKLMVMIIVIIMQNWTLSVNFDKKHNLMVPSRKTINLPGSKLREDYLRIVLYPR